MNQQASPVTTKQKIAVMLLSAVFAVLLAEFAVRTHDLGTIGTFFSGHRNELLTTETVRPFRMFGVDHYQERDGVRFIASRHGELFPLIKRDDVFRIVVFGGSTSENPRTFDEYQVHYPLLLQSILNDRNGGKEVEVINVANNAYSTVHSLILLELDVLSWNPDLVVLSHNINDLLAAYWPDFSFDYSSKYSHPFYLRDYRQTFTLTNALFQHLQVYWIAKSTMRKASRIAQDPQNTELPRRSYGDELDRDFLSTFERNLRSFVTLATRNGIQIVLGSQPLHTSVELFNRHMSYKPYNDVVVYPLHEEFVEHHRSLNDAIERICDESSDCFFVDNGAVMNDRDEYFIDYVHYSLPGTRALATNYADLLVAEGRSGKIDLGSAPE